MNGYTWIQTHAGRRMDLLHPRPEDIDLEDIAWALAHTCRFVGHSEWHYSVAQHSVLVADVLFNQANRALFTGWKPLVRAGLLHDASEAYLGDVSKPLKSVLPEYQALEERMNEAIELAFGLPAGSFKRPEVKVADLALLERERMVVMGVPREEAQWSVCPNPADVRVVRWSFDEARRNFLSTAESLGLGGVCVGVKESEDTTHE